MFEFARKWGLVGLRWGAGNLAWPPAQFGLGLAMTALLGMLTYAVFSAPWPFWVLFLVGVLLVALSVVRGVFNRFFSAHDDAVYYIPLPPWLGTIMIEDRNNLSGKFHIMGDHQRGNVSFNLEDEREPSIYFTFWMVNASIYTVRISDVRGALQVNHKAISGKWKIKQITVRHNERFRLQLQHVIDTEASERAMRALVAGPQTVHFALDSVRVVIIPEQAEEMPGELAFPQQYWQPPTMIEA